MAQAPGLSFKNIVNVLKGGSARRQSFTPEGLKQPLVTPEERESYHNTIYGKQSVAPSNNLEVKQASGLGNPMHHEESLEPYPNLNRMSNALGVESTLSQEDKNPFSKPKPYNNLNKMFGKNKI